MNVNDELSRAIRANMADGLTFTEALRKAEEQLSLFAGPRKVDVKAHTRRTKTGAVPVKQSMRQAKGRKPKAKGPPRQTVQTPTGPISLHAQREADMQPLDPGRDYPAKKADQARYAASARAVAAETAKIGVRPKVLDTTPKQQKALLAGYRKQAQADAKTGKELASYRRYYDYANTGWQKDMAVGLPSPMEANQLGRREFDDAITRLMDIHEVARQVGGGDYNTDFQSAWDKASRLGSGTGTGQVDTLNVRWDGGGDDPAREGYGRELYRVDSGGPAYALARHAASKLGKKVAVVKHESTIGRDVMEQRGTSWAVMLPGKDTPAAPVTPKTAPKITVEKESAHEWNLNVGDDFGAVLSREHHERRSHGGTAMYAKDRRKPMFWSFQWLGEHSGKPRIKIPDGTNAREAKKMAIAHMQKHLAKGRPTRLVVHVPTLHASGVQPLQKAWLGDVVEWVVEAATCRFRKSDRGVGVLTVTGPSALPYHVVVKSVQEARAKAVEVVDALKQGRTPSRGVFRLDVA